MTDRMNPATAIAPTRLVRRSNAKRYHLRGAGPKGAPSVFTACGIAIHNGIEKTAYNAAEIDCTDCLSASIGRRISELEAEGLSTSDAQAVADAEAIEAPSSEELDARAFYGPSGWKDRGTQPRLDCSCGRTSVHVPSPASCYATAGSTIATDAGVVIVEQRHVDVDPALRTVRCTRCGETEREGLVDSKGRCEECEIEVARAARSMDVPATDVDRIVR